MDSFYRFVGSLLPQRKSRLHRAVRRALRPRRLRIPREMRIFSEGSRGYAMAWWGSESAIAWDDEALGVVAPGLLAKVIEMIDDRRLMEARDAVIGRLGCDRDRAPSWTHLAHPLAIRLLRIGGADPCADGFFHRGGVAIPSVDFGDEAAGGEIQDFNGCATTTGRYEVKRLKASLGGDRAASMLVLPVAGDDDRLETMLLMHGHSIPVDLAIGLPGRPLLDVVDLSDGYAMIDEALRTLTIVGASSNEHGSSFTIAPARWITCGRPPEGFETWDAGTPWIA